MIAHLWKTISSKQKAQYVTLANQDQERYKRESRITSSKMDLEHVEKA